MKKLIQIYELIRDSVTSWSQTEAFWYAAGLSFYTIFSFAPLLTLTIGIVSMFISQALAPQTVTTIIERLIGPQLAALAEETITQSSVSSLSDLKNSLNTSGFITSLIGLGILFYSASLFFQKLGEALNAMWDIKIQSEGMSKSLIIMVRNRLVGAAAVLVFGILMLALIMVMSFFMVGPMQTLEKFFPGITESAALLSLIITPLIFWLVFSLVYKFLPQAKVRWRDILPGAALTAMLFFLGNGIIWLTISFNSYGAVYGAAASLIGLLVWVNYSTVIVLYGAKFIQLYAQRYGVPITPIETNISFLEKLMSKYTAKN